MSASLRAAIVLGGVLLLALPGTAQRRETEIDTDLRRFYEAAGNRGVWIDVRGRPTLDAQRVLARLRDVAEDGLEPGDYRVDELGRQAMALDAGEPFAAVDAAAFDVGLTASVLRYFRHLHLGRVSPRALGFHLDHAIEPHDFPARLQAALADHSFDRAIADLRPAFAQYRGLRQALTDYRAREPARARQIELAMERLRWLPDVSGQRLLVVNIPMYYLWGWEAQRAGGMPAISMAAIIGTARSTKTPVFSAAMTSVVFNPDWTVPDSIVRNEILPAIEANPQYLAQHHMDMTATGGTPRVRQRAGPWNALGRVKFLLPNVHDVYLHDTPSQSLFSNERRDFSHGCVRVADPLALAEWVMQNEAGWSPDSIRAAIARGETRTVRLTRQTHVVVFYMTAAFAPEDGGIRFADDIYGHDARLDAWLHAQGEEGDR